MVSAKVREQSTELLPQYATTTKTAVVVGTPQYISPEQAMGKKGDDIDARADIYSLGITLYEMLTGKLPFQSATPVGMLVQHITATPKSPAELLAQPPNPLSEIVMKALQKSRDNRYQTADEMAADIAKAQPVHTPQPAAGVPTPAPRTTGTFTPKPGTVMIKFETPKATKAAPVESRPSASAGVKTPPPMSTPKLRTGSSAAAAAPAVASIAEPIFDRSHPAPQVKAPTFDAMEIDEKPGSKTPLIAIGAVLGILILGALIFWPKKSATPKADAVEQTAIKGDDGKLLLDVQQLLATSPTFNNVNATVDKGVVTLSGLVASKGDSDRADGIVKNSIGVTDVKNEIVVNAKAIARLEAPINAPKPAPAKAVKGKTVAAAPAPAPVAAAPVNPGQLRARAMIALGNRQVDSGDYSGALNAFQSALILDPGNAAAEAGLRRANEAMKNH